MPDAKLNISQRAELEEALALASDEDALSGVLSQMIHDRDTSQRLMAGHYRALNLCASHAGVPDPSEGCRLVIATVRDAVGVKP